MGLVFEELIRKFAEIPNETAGEHFTPREVIRLMVNLLFIEDDDVLAKPGVVRTVYDPTPASCEGCLDRTRKDEGRVRNSLQSVFLRSSKHLANWRQLMLI
jgi:hypothetical protein